MSYLRLTISALFGLSVCIGCIPAQIKLADVSKVSIKGAQKITVVVLQSPTFVVPPKPAFGASSGAGAATAIVRAAGTAVDVASAGGWLEDIFRVSPPDDPIEEIRDQFLAAIANSLDQTKIEKLDETMTLREFERRKEEWKPVLVEFHTDDWGVRREVTGVDYIFRYRAVAKITRLPQGEILWQGVCQVGSTWDGDRLSFEDLIENDSAGLKKQLGKTAHLCAEQLVRQFTS